MDRLTLFDATVEEWKDQHLLVAEFSPMKISHDDIKMETSNFARPIPTEPSITTQTLNTHPQTQQTPIGQQSGGGKIHVAGAKLSNKITAALDHNPNRRPIFPGEKHMILPTKYGYSVANYAGPGTHLEERLARGDPPVDGPHGIDAAAEKHDIDYAIAKDYHDIEVADEKLIKRVKKAETSLAAKAAVITAVKAKQFGEKVGIISKNYFSGLGDATDHTVPTSTLIQSGTGKGKGKGRKRPRDAVPGGVRPHKRSRMEVPLLNKVPEFSTEGKVGQKNNYPSIYQMVAAK